MAPPHIVRSSAVVSLGLVLLLAGCSDSATGADGTADDGTGSTSVPATPGDAGTGTETGPYEGDDFYEVPSPLPDGDHGTLIRYQPMDDYEIEGATTYRILYLSASLQGEPIAVSGMASVPDAPAPDEGRPMVTISHGTTGIADDCAPSKAPARTEMTLVGGALGAEYLIAHTDYEGLGTPGRHPYLVGESEGRSTLDAIVAAGQLPDAEPGRRVAIAGYSQGGHGALWTSQLAADWAPDLEVVGTFAGAPSSEIDIILAAAPNLPVAGFAYMVVAGFAEAYPEADPGLFLTEAGEDRLDEVDEGCARDIIEGFVGSDAAELIRPDGPSSDPWQRLARENNAATTKTNEAPTLVIHSQKDTTVPIIFSQLLLNRMCANGQVVERRVLPEGGHGDAALPAYDQAMDWIQERFAADPPDSVSSC